MELLREVEFPDFAGGFVVFGVLEGEVGEDDPGEGVVAGGELGSLGLVVEEFDGAELEAEAGFGEIELRNSGDCPLG
jgi:hypothetical protein